MARMTVGDVHPVLGLPDAPAPEPAPWSHRVVAVVLDTMLLSVVAWLAAPGSAVPGMWPGLPLLPDPAQAPVTGSEAVGPTSSWVVATAIVLQLLLQGWTGATVGKRAVGLVVVGATTGRPPGVLRTLVRQVLHVLDAILLIGYLRPLWEARRRTFADSLAGTVVVSAPWPPAWRAVPPGARRWSRPAAAALCVVGVLGSVPWSGGGMTTAADSVCEVDSGPAGSTARVQVDVYRSWETRLGVRREIPVPPAPWTVRWAALDDGWATQDVRVETTVTAQDGPQEGRIWRGRTPNTVADEDGRLTQIGEVTRTAPPATGSFHVASSVVVDGATVATCTARVRIDADDLVVPGP